MEDVVWGAAQLYCVIKRGVYVPSDSFTVFLLTGTVIDRWVQGPQSGLEPDTFW